MRIVDAAGADVCAAAARMRRAQAKCSLPNLLTSRHKGHTVIEALFGGRALADYRKKHAALMQLSAFYSAPPLEVPQRAGRAHRMGARRPCRGARAAGPCLRPRQSCARPAGPPCALRGPFTGRRAPLCLRPGGNLPCGAGIWRQRGRLCLCPGQPHGGYAPAGHGAAAALGGKGGGKARAVAGGALPVRTATPSVKPRAFLGGRAMSRLPAKRAHCPAGLGESRGHREHGVIPCARTMRHFCLGQAERRNSCALPLPIGGSVASAARSFWCRARWRCTAAGPSPGTGGVRRRHAYHRRDAGVHAAGFPSGSASLHFLGLAGLVTALAAPVLRRVPPWAGFAVCSALFWLTHTIPLGTGLGHAAAAGAV